MMPPPPMGPPRARPVDQTTGGFAFAAGAWDDHFDRRGAVTLAAAEAAPTEFCVFTAGGLPLPEPEPQPAAAAEGQPAGQAAGGSPVFVLLHGGGLSSLSWALVAGALKKQGRAVLAYDLRAHGRSGGEAAELTIEQLCADTVALLQAATGASPLVLAGHSLGGVVAARVGCCDALRERVLAVAMVDIVETAAMAGLDRMEAMLARRPTQFPSPAAAIGWATSSGMVGNPMSAAVSIPALLRQCEEPKSGAGAGAGAAAGAAEGSTGGGSDGGGGGSAGSEGWEWILDVRRTAAHWAGWFEGLDAAFLQSGAQQKAQTVFLFLFDDVQTLLLGDFFALLSTLLKSVLCPVQGRRGHGGCCC